MKLSYHPILQPRDQQTLGELVRCYRYLRARDYAEQYGVSLSTARKRLDRLTAGRLLYRLTALAADPPNINSPLASWRPGDPPPDFASIATILQQRTRAQLVRRVTLYTASNKLRAYYGLAPRPRLKLIQATHDLALLAVYRYCRAAWPGLEFIGEDLFTHQRGHGEGVEDALLVQGDQVVAAVEYLSSYRRDRIEHAHQHIAERELPYFLF